MDGTKSPVRKPYLPPKVFDYGDIRQITSAISNNTMTADGGTGKTNKTG
jgi:hypothetical protein